MAKLSHESQIRMVLFFVGIIEMTIAASWTRSVAKSSVYVNGLITYANIFVWYYVIDQVVNHLSGWTAIIPYAAGCAIGSMLGSTGPKAIRMSVRRTYRKFAKSLKVSRARKATPVRLRAPAEL